MSKINPRVWGDEMETQVAMHRCEFPWCVYDVESNIRCCDLHVEKVLIFMEDHIGPEVSDKDCLFLALNTDLLRAGGTTSLPQDLELMLSFRRSPLYGEYKARKDRHQMFLKEHRTNALGQGRKTGCPLSKLQAYLKWSDETLWMFIEVQQDKLKKAKVGDAWVDWIDSDPLADVLESEVNWIEVEQALVLLGRKIDPHIQCRLQHMVDMHRFGEARESLFTKGKRCVPITLLPLISNFVSQIEAKLLQVDKESKVAIDVHAESNIATVSCPLLKNQLQERWERHEQFLREHPGGCPASDLRDYLAMDRRAFARLIPNIVGRTDSIPGLWLEAPEVEKILDWNLNWIEIPDASDAFGINDTGREEFCRGVRQLISTGEIDGAISLSNKGQQCILISVLPQLLELLSKQPVPKRSHTCKGKEKRPLPQPNTLRADDYVCPSVAANITGLELSTAAGWFDWALRSRLKSVDGRLKVQVSDFVSFMEGAVNGTYQVRDKVFVPQRKTREVFIQTLQSWRENGCFQV